MKLSRNTWNLNEVFLGTEHRLEFQVENRGDIVAPFEFEVPESVDRKVTFEPQAGEIAVGGKVQIACTLIPTSIGDIDSQYNLCIKGSPEPIVFHIKGKAIGPIYKFDTADINFGNISHGFPSDYYFNVSNKSPIPMNFNLRVESEHAEYFNVKPSMGCIPAKSSMKMKITCVPQSLGLIQGKLVMDVKEIGASHSELNVEAMANAPEV